MINVTNVDYYFFAEFNILVCISPHFVFGFLQAISIPECTYISLVSLEIKKSENSEYHTMINFTGKKRSSFSTFQYFWATSLAKIIEM